jgi:hypothetical protein
VTVRLLGRYLNSETEVARLRDLCEQAHSRPVRRTPAEEGCPRRSAKKLKPAQCAEILRRYEAGDRVIDIARDFGVRTDAIRALRRRRELPVRSRGMSAADVDHAAELRANGLSLRKIAIEVGFSASAVTRALRAHGVI